MTDYEDLFPKDFEGVFPGKELDDEPKELFNLKRFPYHELADSKQMPHEENPGGLEAAAEAKRTVESYYSDEPKRPWHVKLRQKFSWWNLWNELKEDVKEIRFYVEELEHYQRGAYVEVTVKLRRDTVVATWRTPRPPALGEYVNGRRVIEVEWEVRPDSDGHFDSYDIDEATGNLRKVIVTLE